jgi:hypothetical protein
LGRQKFGGFYFFERGTFAAPLSNRVPRGTKHVTAKEFFSS